MVKAHFQTFEKYRKLKEENYAIALPTRNYHYIHSFLFTLGLSEYLIFFFLFKGEIQESSYENTHVWSKFNSMFCVHFEIVYL